MRDWTGLWLVLIAAAIVAFMFGVLIWYQSIACHSQWSDSKFAVKFGVMSGCRIQLADGSWIPASNYRELK